LNEAWFLDGAWLHHMAYVDPKGISRHHAPTVIYWIRLLKEMAEKNRAYYI